MCVQNKYYPLKIYDLGILQSCLLGLSFLKEIDRCRGQYTLANVYMEMCHAVSARC